MKIDELEANAKVVNLVGVIAQLGEENQTPNDVSYKEGILEDSSGQVKITFWNDDTKKYKEGDKILMSTGWCKEFQGELQVSAGKFGKISLVPPTPDEEPEIPDNVDPDDRIEMDDYEDRE